MTSPTTQQNPPGPRPPGASRSGDDVGRGRAAMTFWLGTHQPGWLERTTVPLFVSHRRLADRRQLPRARGRWALDSGAFSEIAEHGQFTTTPNAYAAAVDRYATQIGRLEWAAIQDWMCEPFMLTKTGLTVAEHQARTIASLLELRTLAPHLPWVPVIQGFTAADYLTCIDLYDNAGIDLTKEPLVGLGSVCRRQATTEIATLITELVAHDLNLHGFGVKTGGLDRYGPLLASADSMAWSTAARYQPPLPGCTHTNCANCLRYALTWRANLACILAGWPRTPISTVTKPPPAVSSRTCPTCAGPITLPSTGRPPVYCRAACRQTAYRRRRRPHRSWRL